MQIIGVGQAPETFHVLITDFSPENARAGFTNFDHLCIPSDRLVWRVLPCNSVAELFPFSSRVDSPLHPILNPGSPPRFMINELKTSAINHIHKRILIVTIDQGKKS